MKIKDQKIQQKTQIEHVLHRPGMYIGSIVEERVEGFGLVGEKFEIVSRSYVKGLVKAFNEVIDNSIDEYVRTKGQFATVISVQMTDTTFRCFDNGRGIPNEKMVTLTGETKYQAEVAFTEMLSGSNYDNKDEATIGTNGLGSKASSIFSTKSVIQNSDGKTRVTIETKNHLEEIKVQEDKTTKRGVDFTITPDLEYFGIQDLSAHFDIIRERLLHLSISYPNITFKFNKKSMKLSNKTYFGMFGTPEIIQLSPNVVVAVGPSASDGFEHFSLVNGIITSKGGSHIRFLSDNIVRPIREKLAKRFKTIKPADVRNKIRLVVVMNNFMNTEHESQTKEDIANSDTDIRAYLGDCDFNKVSQKVQRNEDIMLGITEYFTLKEQAKENAELKKLKKTKKVKSEKYLPATKKKKVLFLAEGDSAVGGLMPALGRDEYGFYACRGVPLNAYEVTRAKFMANKELSEIYQIVETEGYEYVAIASDQDQDGSHIKGLFLGFFMKYFPKLVEDHKFGELQTPIQAVIKNKKIQRWVYSTLDDLNLGQGETGKFFKGLGSWKEKDLQHVVASDGIEHMLKMFEVDDIELVDDWLSKEKVPKRKEYLQDNYFDITSA